MSLVKLGRIFVDKVTYKPLTSPLAYGFLGGEQVKAEGVGNIGLEDRRFFRCKVIAIVAETGPLQNASL